MNWFTTEFHQATTLAKKQKLVEQDGGCEHVEADANLVYVVHYEKDSFGPVSSHAICEACEQHRKQQEQEEEHVCYDCAQTVARKDGAMWRHWNHSASEGDEALFICKSCLLLPKHVNRVKSDKADYAAEQDFYDQ